MAGNKGLKKTYLAWLIDKIADEEKKLTYNELFHILHTIDFKWSIVRDVNRSLDGLSLRYRFSCEMNYDPEYVDDILDFRCSVLEMMVALSLRCEETIMSNPEYGDRTKEWFWIMIDNLKLTKCKDGRCDLEYVERRVQLMMDRKYGRDGSGGALFVVPNPEEDMRKTEIWYQLNWYLIFSGKE